MKQLNLLSPESRRRAVAEWQAFALWRLLAAGIVVMMFGIAEIVLASTSLSRKTALQVIAYQEQATQLEGDLSANELARRQKESQQFIRTIAEKNLHPILWTGVVMDLSDAVPEGVTIASLQFTEKQAHIILKARDRTAALSVESALEETGLFTAVDLPLSSLFDEGPIELDLTLPFESSALNTHRL